MVRASALIQHAFDSQWMLCGALRISKTCDYILLLPRRRMSSWNVSSAQPQGRSGLDLLEEEGENQPPTVSDV
jgi:hypothetical protein